MATEEDPDALLAVYLTDHLAGSTGGVELARRLARAERAWSGGAELARVAEEVAQDREALRRIMARLGVSPSLPKTCLAWLGERVGRLKPNRRVLGRSRLSRVIELEVMRLGVEGKLAGWYTLLTVAESEPRLEVDELTGLASRATEQSALLATLRSRAAQEAFTKI
jgi:hypothetical protein